MARVIDYSDNAHMVEGFEANLTDSTGTTTLVLTLKNNGVTVADNKITPQTSVRVYGAVIASGSYEPIHDAMNKPGVYTFITQSGTKLKVVIDKLTDGDKFSVEEL